MKINLLILFAFLLSSTLAFSQGNSQGKGKNKDAKESKEKNKGNGSNEKHSQYDDVIWGGTANENGGGCKASKNQPSKVRANFQRDYPNANNVRWCKYRGDWTATFSNNLFGRATAVYHANGDRKDTRSVFPWNNVPNKIVQSVQNENPNIKIGDVVKIEFPQQRGSIFRVGIQGMSNAPNYVFYNDNGIKLSYDY